MGEERCALCRSAALRGSSFFFAEGKAAEALIEARHLAARVEQLLVAAGPRRMHLRVDVEVHGVAFLAPGRANLELGAVGHFDVDHVIIGVNTGLHVTFPWVSCWFPTSGRELRARLKGRGRKVQP